jgi:hypothetical protein
MRYTYLSNIGGFLWWFFIKFCKTKLEDEQTQNYWARNIFFLCLIGIAIGFVSVKILKIK